MNAIPKPRPYARTTSRINTTGLQLAKKHPVRSAGKRAFVRRHPCALRDEGFGDCPTRRIECAHVETGGMGIKCSDNLTAPLCTDGNGRAGHHHLYDEHKLPKRARVIVARVGQQLDDEWRAKQEEKSGYMTPQKG